MTWMSLHHLLVIRPIYRVRRVRCAKPYTDVIIRTIPSNKPDDVSIAILVVWSMLLAAPPSLATRQPLQPEMLSLQLLANTYFSSDENDAAHLACIAYIQPIERDTVVDVSDWM